MSPTDGPCVQSDTVLKPAVTYLAHGNLFSHDVHEWHVILRGLHQNVLSKCCKVRVQIDEVRRKTESLKWEVTEKVSLL